MSSSSSATDPGNRSSAEIEREVEATRAGLTDTLETLRDRASPGQLFEQAVEYARSSGGAEMVRNLGQSVRDNPLPLLLIGAGVGWLMFGNGNRPGHVSSIGTTRSYSPSGARFRAYGGTDAHVGVEGDTGPSMTDRASSTVGHVGDSARGLRDSVTGAASQAADKAGAAYQSVADTASSAANRASAAASSAAGRASAVASSAADRISGFGHGAREQVSHLGEGARERVDWLLHEQPLVLGAIGLAVGAAVGAMLPGTETEDRLMGEARDSVAEQAQAAAREGYERVKDTASEHLEHAKATVGEAAGQAKEHLGGTASTAGQLGDVITGAAQQLRHAARDAAHDIAGEARGAMQSDKPGGTGPSGDKAQPHRTEPPATGPQISSPRGPV